jgi:hypothetical protein
MATFKREYKNWVEYRKLPDLVERDFHWSKEEHYLGFYENMEQVVTVTLQALQDAQKNGKQYLLLTHGSSTSGSGRISARSQIRKLMRSKEATPFIVRNRCIQHDSVFVAAIRPICA